MKKLLVLVFALALVVVLQPAQDAQAAMDGSQVAICHFDGHEGPIRPDFVITGRGFGCTGEGGNPIIVGTKACERGHAATGDCNRDNVDRCQVCKGPAGDSSPASHEH